MSEKLGPKTKAFYDNWRAISGCPPDEYAAWRELEFASQQEQRAEDWRRMAERLAYQLNALKFDKPHLFSSDFIKPSCPVLDDYYAMIEREK